MIDFHADRQAHPILEGVRQIAPNQIVISYDQPTDLATVTKAENYWIRSNLEESTDFTDLEMSKPLSPRNAMRPEMVTITAVDNTNMRFCMTFMRNAMPGVLYVVLPSFINLEGKSGYMGENWGPYSKNAFYGM